MDKLLAIVFFFLNPFEKFFGWLFTSEDKEK